MDDFQDDQQAQGGFDPTGGAVSGLTAVQGSGGMFPQIDLSRLLSASPVDPSLKWRAFAAGLGKPNTSGLGTAVSNGLDSMVSAEQKQEELKAKYIPVIAQAMVQQQMNQYTMMLNQYKLTQDWSNALTGRLTGLLANPNSGFNDAVSAVASAVNQGQVPQAFAQHYLATLPKDPETLRSYIRASAISLMNPNERVGAVTPKIDIQDVGAAKVPVNTNPNAGAVAPVGAPIPIGLKPNERLPKVESTPAGTTVVSPLTGQGGYVGTPEAAAAAAAGAAPADAATGAPPSAAATPGSAPLTPGSAPLTPGGTTQVPGTPTGPSGRLGKVNPAEQKYGEDAGAAMAKYETELNNRVDELSSLSQRITAMRDDLSKFRAGASADVRMNIASHVKDWAQNLGMSPQRASALGDSIMGGQLSAAQDFQKLAVQGAMESLKAAMNSGRITQGEFAVFQRNNPNVEMDPQAIEKISNFLTLQYQRASAEQQALSNFKRTPGNDITQFPSFWNKEQQRLGYITPAVSSGNAVGSTAAKTKARVGVSTSGRPLIFRNGQWEYDDAQP